jgi:arginine decarboxylase
VLSDLKKICPSLRALNIGGGFPIKNSLNFNYDYAYLVEEIISLIKAECVESGIEEPAIYTEFGTFSVGESGAVLYKILDQKQQNDREKWNMIDGSFMTTLPDTWALNKRFVMLPLNRWGDTYERVFLGGLTCDSDDYYNHEQHVNAIYLPVFKKDEPLYIGFFNTGAYQDTIGGVGGLHHCLIPDPQHVLIDRDENGELTYKVFASQQDESVMMNILGYK